MAAVTSWINGSISDRVDQVVRDNHAGVAVSDGAYVLRYAELALHSAQIARHMIARGVRPGDRAAMFFDRSPIGLAAMLGALKSGAVLVPLVPGYPSERLRQILDDADPTVLLTDRLHEAEARALVGTRLDVLQVDELAAEDSPDCPWPVIGPQSHAVILYTSGSTGRPKGVLQTHGFILQKHDRMARVVALTPADRLAFFSTITVAQGFTTVMMAFLSGATVCPFDVRRAGLVSLARWLVHGRISIYLSSATLLRNLMRTLPDGERFPHVRVVRVGGERVTSNDVDAASRFFPHARLVVIYSCTEAGAIAMHAVEPGETFHEGNVPVGLPLEGIRVQVLGDDGQERAAGEEGEIAVTSRFMSAAYWRDAERTAQTFAIVGGQTGLRCYRTGDLGRIRSDGRLEHLGRKDLRVKIRGFRIEIEEVEAVLGQDPSVFRAAVAARPDAEGDMRLVAYVQMAPGAQVTVDVLRARAGLRLAEHMIPSMFVTLDELPLTDSGKVARSRLPEPSPERPVLATPMMAARSTLEAAIADTWREVLGLESVGVHDAFFSVGGDSLKATLVASRLSTRLGIELPMWVLFEASTVAELAVAVARHLPAEEPT